MRINKGSSYLYIIEEGANIQTLNSSLESEIPTLASLERVHRQ